MFLCDFHWKSLDHRFQYSDVAANLDDENLFQKNGVLYRFLVESTKIENA